MEIELTDASGLPEALKPLAVTADGKTRLDLSKVMPVEDLTGLKTALQREREAAGAWSKFGKPDELAKKIEALEAQVAKGGKGSEEAQAKLDALAKAKDDEIAAERSKTQRLLTRTAGAELRSELAKAGFIPEAIDDIAASAMARVKFDDDGNAKIVTADGKPMMGTGADYGATFADLAKELAAAKPYAVRDAGAGGGGKPPGSNGAAGGKTMSRSAFDALNQYGRAAFIKEGGKVID